MTEKEEKYGCLSKSLKSFLDMKEEKRRKKYGNDVNKYYERVVKNVNATVSDIMLAYNKLPQEQKDKINLLVHVQSLLDFVDEKQIKSEPIKFITTVKQGLYAIIRSHIHESGIAELAEPDFNKVSSWLEYLTPKDSTKKVI